MTSPPACCLRDGVSQDGKMTWKVSILFYHPYIHRQLQQILATCWPQVARVCFSLLWIYQRSNKLETHQVSKLVQYCLLTQISTDFFETLCQNYFNNVRQRSMHILARPLNYKSVCRTVPAKLGLLITQITKFHNWTF